MLDQSPEEPKTLIEEKLKKVTTEKAPVAGAGGAGGAGPGIRGPGAGANLTPRQQQSLISHALSGAGVPGGMSNIQDLNELVQRSTRGDGGQGGGSASTLFGGPGTGSGAAAAAGVLTAVDEDNEGDEEAAVPGEFDYFTDADDEDGE